MTLASIFAVALCTATAFATARFWPDAPPPTPAQPAPSFQPVTAAPAPWLSLKGGARVAACLDHSATVSASEWPAHFVRYQHDELLRPALLEAWIAEDPAGVWKWLLTQKDAALLAEAGPRLFSSWARMDPDAAFAASALIASPHLRDPLRSRVLETVLAQDLSAGMALVAKCGPLTSAVQDLTWVKKDPVAAVRALCALPGGSMSFRARCLSAATRILAKDNPRAFLEWLETKPRLDNHEIWHYHFTEAPVADAARAIAAASGLAPGLSRDHALRGAITAAAAVLPASEIVQSATANLSGWERLAAVSGAAEDTARTDPVKAAELLASLPACRYVRYAAGNVAAGFAKTDWNAARQWAEALPDVPTRRVALEALSCRIPPEQAQEFAAAAATLPLQELTDDILQNVHKALQSQSAASAAQWLNSLPPDRAAWAKAVK